MSSSPHIGLVGTLGDYAPGTQYTETFPTMDDPDATNWPGCTFLTSEMPTSNQTVKYSFNTTSYYHFASAIEFVDDNESPLSNLKVSQWVYAFENNPCSVKAAFPDASDDETDRFYVKVRSPEDEGAGTITAAIGTDSPGTAYDDSATNLELTETATNSGVFLSESLILVSNEADDNFTNANIVADDTLGDRTHIVALGGTVTAAYQGNKVEAGVPVLGAVTVNIVILRDEVGGTPAVSTNFVEQKWALVSENYAQVGVDVIVAGISTEDPPDDERVDLSDGNVLVETNALSGILAAEAKGIIDAYGTAGTNVDIHVFYVNGIKRGDNDGIVGCAVADYYHRSSEDSYIYNIFLTDYDNPFMTGHELLHLLADEYHSARQENLLYETPSSTDSETATKRIDWIQSSKVMGNDHVKKD